MLICCNLSKIFDSTIRGRHPYLPAQRTALPQHFSKRGLSIEAATLHRLPHASLRLGGCSFHISRWMEKLNISVTILERINKRCYVLTKLSAKSHWRGTRRVFSLKYTFDLLGGGWLLVNVAVSCEIIFFSWKGPVSGESQMSQILQCLERTSYINLPGIVTTRFP